MGKRENKKFLGLRAAAVAAVLCVVMLCACGDKEEEIPMGRYADRDVKLPGAGYDYMHPCQDGSYWLFGDKTDLTHVSADGTVSREKWGWENNANIHVKFSYGVSDEGAVIFGYTPMFYSDEEYEAYAAEGDNRYLYYYVSAEGDRHPLTLYGADYRKATNLYHFAFAPDGRVYAASDSCMYRIDVESGETESLFATQSQVREFAFVGDTMLAVDGEKGYLYDMAGEKLLADNNVLNEFVKSHQSGRIVLAVGGQEDVRQETEQAQGDASPVLYLACRTGLYRYVWNGSVIEQIADGQMTALGDSQYQLCALQILENEQFRVYFSGNYMAELYYDETLPMKPSKELAVYSLRENGRIRYAGRLFQKEHPDVLVRYETGMDGDNAVSREDALKNLNTRILAGEVPDVIILDDMDMEQYADKGVLKELDGILAPYMEEGVLYQNILEGMRTTEKDKIYGVPMTVELPLYYGEKKYVDGMQGLEGIVSGAERARAQHPEGPLIDTPYQSNLFDLLIPLCLPAWTEEDGSLDTGSLASFYQNAAKLWELDSAGMSEERRRKWQQDTAGDERDLTNIMFGQYEDIDNIGETWIALGYMKNAWYGMTNLHTKMENYREGYSTYKKPEDEVVYGRLTGQAGNIYRARTITGLCEKAEEPELGEAFMELLLSDTMMQKWWLEGAFDGGFPIRKESLSSLLDFNNHAFAEIKGWTQQDISVVYKDYFWPTEEEMQWLFDTMEESDCCYRPGTALEEAVREIGVRVLEGELTPEEGAREVERKMAISMKSKRLLFLLPGFSGVMLFYLFPFFEVVRRSFFKSGNRVFVGVDNYRAVFENGAFLLALRNTFLYMATGVPLLMGISLLLSLLLRNLALRRRLVSVMLLPMAVPAAVMVLTMQILIDRQGVINGILTYVSEKITALPAFSAIDYLNTGWALVVVVCSFLWKNTGYMVILWLAGLAALPKEVEEAAQVDGANRWQSWHYIIRPGLSGSFFTIGMLSVLQIFKSYREVWMVAGSYPQERIYFLQHLLQNWYLKLEFDRMAALTVILSLVLLAVCLLLQKKLG